MKKILFCFVVLAVFLKWDVISTALSPAAVEVAPVHDSRVVLYATAWCGYCKKTRALLKQLEIPYIEYDVEKSAEGRLQHYRLGGGGVPVLVLDGKVVRGWQPAKIVQFAERS